MHYPQYQQPSPAHARTQSQPIIFQHQYQSFGTTPQVEARPSPLQQHNHSVSFPQPSSSQSSGVQEGRSAPNLPEKTISTEEDIHRLFHVCKTGRGHASLLQESLAFMKPDELVEKGITQEFLGRCRASQEVIFSQIPWATSLAERRQPKHKSHKRKETTEERLLAELLATNEVLLDAIKAYENMERLRHDQAALEQSIAEHKMRALDAVVSFQPTSAESAIVDQIFNLADTRKIGSISSHAAFKIFSGSRVSPRVLADIWRIANVEENEMLSKQVIGVAVRLIGHAQQSGSTKVEDAWVASPGSLARIDGLEPSQERGFSSNQSVKDALPPLTVEDRVKFMKIFARSQPVQGILSADRASAILKKSRLSTEILAQIWDLADIQHQGYLDATAFVIAMYLVQAIMSGKLKSIPQSLPSSIYFDASPLSHEHSPVTAPLPLSPMSPTSSSFLQTPGAGPSTSSAHLWGVSRQEKVTADEFFNVLDEQNQGFLEGKVVRAHLLLSGLPEQDVKKIWKLVDINGDGQLGRDEFAVALHLMETRQHTGFLPNVLPSNLIPPSMRPAANHGNIQEASLIDLADSAPLHSITPLQPTPTGPSLSPVIPNSSTLGTSPSTSGFLDGLPSTSRNLNAPSTLLSFSGRSASNPLPNRVSSAPATRPSTTSPISPTFTSVSGSVSQPHLSPTSPATSRSDGWNWDVTPAEKASSDRFFDMLDPWKHGYIEGEAAVPFMSKSKLPESVLADIWDLADADADGKLSRDDFAIAMHLIKAKLAGVEVPDTLPPSLQPPLRSSRIVPPVEEPSPFDDPATLATVVVSPPSPNPSTTHAEERRRSNIDHDRPLPPAPPEVELPPDEPPRSQTPPPPYALIADDVSAHT
ncbi:EF-hand [Cristinia sonorae]|uniref:EF-hand n=1 Tax=Cristinia sonorae TaxID=1940300 RepID=A0A8K0XRV5_9AGAR|nr:EF-hand [Cristinia sonorae]